MTDSNTRSIDDAAVDAAAVKRYLSGLQDRISAAVEKIDTVKFRRDAWNRPEGGGGESRVLSDGAAFERAGVSIAHVFGGKMPPTASNLRPEVAGAPFEAMGLSLVPPQRRCGRTSDHDMMSMTTARGPGLTRPTQAQKRPSNQ